MPFSSARTMSRLMPLRTDGLAAPCLEVEVVRVGLPGGDQHPQGLVECQKLAIDLLGQGQRLIVQGCRDPGSIFQPLRVDGPQGADPGQSDQDSRREDDPGGANTDVCPAS